MIARPVVADRLSVSTGKNNISTHTRGKAGAKSHTQVHTITILRFRGPFTIGWRLSPKLSVRLYRRMAGRVGVGLDVGQQSLCQGHIAGSRSRTGFLGSCGAV